MNDYDDLVRREVERDGRRLRLMRRARADRTGLILGDKRRQVTPSLFQTHFPLFRRRFFRFADHARVAVLACPLHQPHRASRKKVGPGVF